MDIRSQDILEITRLMKKPANTIQVQNIAPPPPIAQTLTQSEEKAVARSVLTRIAYKSLSGKEKEREILIRRVIKNKDDLFIDGVALDLNAPRLIKVSHILHITDPASGTIYDNPYQFLQQKMGIQIDNRLLPEPMSDLSKAIERTSHEITVLMYLVAIDGVRDKRERQQILDYVKSRTSDLSYNEAELNEYLISLAPNEESFTQALHLALTQPKETVQAFVAAMIKIIMADGNVDPTERAFLMHIISLLEREGFEFSLPI